MILDLDVYLKIKSEDWGDKKDIELSGRTYKGTKKFKNKILEEWCAAKGEDDIWITIRKIVLQYSEG